ncbi:MAG: glycosyltransferase family 9 protein [Duodenibacillus massiliensis]
MCLPALRLLEASGFTPALVGKRWAEDLMSGMGWRFDPIEGHVTEDISRIRYLADNAQATCGLLFPNSFGSALLFKFAPIQTAGLKTDCRSFLLDTKIPEPPKMHEVERFFYVAHEAIKAWGGKPAWDKAPKSLGLML